MERSTSPIDQPPLDDAFFDKLEASLDFDIQSVASDALSGILTLQSEDGQARSYQQIRQEAEVFFDNPVIAENMLLLSQLAAQYADFCHNHGLGLDDADSKTPRRTNKHTDGDHDHSHAAEDTASEKSKKSKSQRSKRSAKTAKSLTTLIFTFSLK